jgi:hypothetical protein
MKQVNIISQMQNPAMIMRLMCLQQNITQEGSIFDGVAVQTRKGMENVNPNPLSGGFKETPTLKTRVTGRSELEACPEKSKGINLSTMCFIGEHQNTRISGCGKRKFIGWDREGVREAEHGDRLRCGHDRCMWSMIECIRHQFVYHSWLSDIHRY